MPSEHMVRHTVDLYPDNDDALRVIIDSNNLKRSRFMRECVNYVLSSATRTQEVITHSKQKTYVKVKRT